MKDTVISETVSHYRILNKLGAGGMGEVYLAQDTRLQRKVAIKFLPFDSRADKLANKRLIREAQAAAKLDHPNICTIHEIGEENGINFIVMQYIEGEALATKIRNAPLTFLEALDIAVQVADALADAHSHGIVHRDIKPQNIMIDTRGQVKVLDFGLAKLFPPQLIAGDDAKRERSLTEPGMILGTVQYMSPQQARGERLDDRSDIFSFGSLLYEMVSGHQPFKADSTIGILAAILTREPPPLAQFRPEVPAELQRVVSKALRKEKDDRYQSAKDLIVDLKSLKQVLAFQAQSNESTYQPPSDEEEIVEGRTLLLPVPVGGTNSLPSILSQKQLPLCQPQPRKTVDSLAILPLVNASADPQTDYLSDGITETIISNLSQLPGLRVMARSTVFRFKGKESDPQAVARDLNVGAVVIGRLLQVSGTLVIGIEMVDAVDGSQIWGEQYKRKLSDIFELQDEISREITAKLHLKLGGKDTERLTKRHTDNAEAYQHYLKGRYQWNKLTGSGFRKSIEFFQQAIDRDRNYALAYSGLADTYASLDDSPPHEAMPRAKAAATKALALDNTLAEAHASLANVAEAYDWDWAAAEREYKRAIEINPGYALAHNWYGAFLSNMGRHDEAIVELKHAQELDPFSLVHSFSVGRALYLARHFDLAIAEYRKAIELDSNPNLHGGLAYAYEQMGMHDEAIAEYQKAFALLGFSLENLTACEVAYAGSGWKGYWQKRVDIAIELARRQYVSAYTIAEKYVRLGEKDKALEYLDRAYKEHDNWLLILKVEPLLDQLRSESRFQVLLRGVGLPQ